jgi:hypothetical protein
MTTTYTYSPTIHHPANPYSKASASTYITTNLHQVAAARITPKLVEATHAAALAATTPAAIVAAVLAKLQGEVA